MENKKELYLKVRNPEGISEQDFNILTEALSKTNLSVSIVNHIDKTLDKEILEQFNKTTALLKDAEDNMGWALGRIEGIKELIKSRYSKTA